MSLLIDELMLECRRKGIKITQKDLAVAAGIGQTAIHKIIRGDTQAPKPQILVAIADCFTDALNRKIMVDDLIAKDDVPHATLATTRNPLKISNWTRLDETEPVIEDDFLVLPVLGDIPCGDLDQVGQGDVVGYQHVYKDKIGRGRFFLRARGDSMAPLILGGDLLLIEPGPEWNNRAVVAVYMDGHVTCKRLYLYDHSAALVSANPNYSPIVVTDEMIILGRVIKIERNLVEGWQP